MNPRYTYMPYGAQQYQYRLSAPTSYYMPYFHPDLGMQYVYVQPYPQMPLISCDPYSYGQSMPVMLRPPFPPMPSIVQPTLGPRSIPNNVRMTRPRANQSANLHTRNGIDTAVSQNTRSAEKTTETTKLGNTDAKAHPRRKDGTNEASNGSPRHGRGPTKKAARKKRVRRSKKAKKGNGGRTVNNVNYEDISSINTDSTQARSKPDVEGRVDGNDDEYETCDEEDLPENQNDIERGTMTQTLGVQSEHVGPVTGLTKPPLSNEPRCRRFVPLYSAKEDYWAAISGIESIWNPSDDSMLCRSRGNGCKCKQCSTQQARLIVPPTPELWWDRSAGMELWPETRNDQNVGATAQKHSATTNPHQTAGYVLVDVNQNCVDGHNEKAVDIYDNIPKRRLLSVDWSSISTPNADNTVRTNSNVENKFKSITEIDSAILERGPLTTESFCLPIVLQPSATGISSTAAMPNSEEIPINILSERMNDRGRLVRGGVQGYFQTAFTSNDISKLNALEQKTSGVESTSNLKSPVKRELRPGEIEAGSVAKCAETPGCIDAHGDSAGLAYQGKAVKEVGAGDAGHVTETVDTQMLVGDGDFVAAKGALDKGRDDTDIPPDSIENASIEGRRKVAVEHGQNLGNGFQFPQSDQIFRERVDADSASPGDNDAELVTVNKKIYEDSKPTPCTTDDVPITTKTIRTEPSSPVNSRSLLSRRRSLSLNDLPLDTEQACKPREIQRLNKKPPPVPVSNKAVKSGSNADKNEACNVHALKIDKPKRAWKQNANRTKYPTGIPLNSMLNDTIRRNFRQKASPVAIFELYRPPTDISSTNLASNRQPSIDDWSEVMVKPVPVGAYCMQQTLLTSQNPGLRTAQYGQTRSPHYLPVPFVLYPSTGVSKARSSDNVGKPRPRRQVIKRRNSFTAVQGVSTTQVRRGRFQHQGVPKSTETKALGYAARKDKVTAIEARPGTSILTSKLDNDRLKKSEERLDKTYPQAQARTSSTEVKLTKQNVISVQQGGADKNVAHSQSAEATRVSAPFGSGECGSVKLKDANQKDAKHTTDEQHSANHEGKVSKDSFLRRMMKRKKWNKQSTLNESKASVREHLTDSQFQPKRKPSRQEKIRANITSKKNRLLGRSSKPRVQGFSSFATQDCNGNSPRPDATQSGECSTTGKSELRPKEPGKRVPREDKNVKHALYRPTLICMAAIETPAQPEADHPSQTTSDWIIHESDRHPRLLDADSSLPGPINQRRENMSVAGTPGVRINSETGDIIETSDVKLTATFLCSTKIAENENINCDS